MLFLNTRKVSISTIHHSLKFHLPASDRPRPLLAVDLRRVRGHHGGHPDRLPTRDLARRRLHHPADPDDQADDAQHVVDTAHPQLRALRHPQLSPAIAI